MYVIAIYLNCSFLAVVAGGYKVRLQLQGCFEEDIKLDFAVAQDVWVGSTACAVLSKHIIHDACLVFRTQVNGLEGDIQCFCHQHGVGGVF